MEKEESPKTEAQEKKDESQIVSVSLFILQCAHSLTTSQQVNDSPRQLDHHGSLIPIHTSLAFSRQSHHYCRKTHLLLATYLGGHHFFSQTLSDSPACFRHLCSRSLTVGSEGACWQLEAEEGKKPGVDCLLEWLSHKGVGQCFFTHRDYHGVFYLPGIGRMSSLL